MIYHGQAVRSGWSGCFHSGLQDPLPITWKSKESVLGSHFLLYAHLVIFIVLYSGFHDDIFI